MNGSSDYEVIRDGMRAYQSFTTDTASVYMEAPLIRGMSWRDPGAIFPNAYAEAEDASQLMELGYVLGKLSGEAGEALEHFWKFMRDTPAPAVALDQDEGGPGKWALVVSEETRAKILKELGDSLWYIAQAARVLDTSLGDVAVDNLAKLRDRAERGVLKGSGDDR